ncbi:uncharacterized protein LOC112602296 [Melanaphis sacchari]|uniref:uncharacterized protein LOC112602296 n=1 Tax=Melanaphis sacchari TaxID=742174 RepID=UPI000DC14F36|nr:uncharacterized protein LOC112602296 [Melanaphis sacchari]
MSSSNKNKCSFCQNKRTIKFNNSKTQQPGTSFVANYDYNMASTSTVQYELPSNPEDDSCIHIRNMTFLKNSYKNVPAPSEQFLMGLNCAVIKLLKEIDENHKIRVKKVSNKQISKRQQHKS